MSETWSAAEDQNKDDNAKTEVKQKKNKGRNDRVFTKCSLKCCLSEDTLKFKLTETYSDKASEIIEKNFSSKLTKFTDIENCSGNSLKAITRAMRLFDEAEVKLSSSSADKFSELFRDKLELDDYACIKKLLSNETTGPLPEDDPVHKSKQDKKKRGKATQAAFTADDCDAFGFIETFKAFKNALSNKKAGEFMDCLMRILENFAFLSWAQQKESIKIIETASKQICTLFDY